MKNENIIVISGPVGVIYFEILQLILKYKLVSFVSLIVLLYFISKKFNIKNYKLYFGVIYGLLAIINLILLKNNGYLPFNIKFNRKIYYFVPFTIFLGTLAYFNINNQLLPFLFGNFIYHLVDLLIF